MRCDAPVPAQSLDIVFVSTVFSSLLDDAYQQRLADAMWAWLKPGGARAVVRLHGRTTRATRTCAACRWRGCARCSRKGGCSHRRVTLAPPLARAVCRMHPALYGLFNALPWLRTHVLAWIDKP